MFEPQDKFVDDLGRILTVTSVTSGVQASLEGEIKMFTSPDSFNNYLKNNNFDKINLTPADHIEEFEQEVQHLINSEENTMATESILTRLDRILESDSKFNKLKKSINVREGISTSTLQFNYYGVLNGSIEDVFEGEFSLKSLRRLIRFVPDKPFLFSISDSERNIVRFFILSDGEYPNLKILSLSVSRTLARKLNPFLVLNLIQDNIRTVKSNLIAGRSFFVRLEDGEEGESLSIKLKTEDTVLTNGSLAQLIVKFKTKGQSATADVYESKIYEEDDEDSDDEDNGTDGIESELESEDISDDDIDTSDDFNDEEEDGDEEEIEADDIEEPEVALESLQRSLRKYCRTNESTIKLAVRKKQHNRLYESVAKCHPRFKKSAVIREFKKMIGMNESISLSFDKVIKNINTRTEDGKTILELEFDDATTTDVTTPVVDTTATETPVEETPVEETPTEETPKTEESFQRRTNRFLNRKI